MRVLLIRGLLIGVIMLLSPLQAYADSYEELLMPGPVVKGHAKYESECTKCHVLFKKGGQNEKCLACHKPVGIDLKKRKGFHGRNSKVKGSECKHCHTDHKGRGADIIQLDLGTFRHKTTDFILKGKHRSVKCRHCHAAGKKYREAPSRCIDCHKQDDLHLGRLGKKCSNCHSEQSWSKGRFDHNKTKFRLTGKHQKVSCNSCHPNQRYKRTPSKCVDCHSLNDVHAGRFGKKCDKCHNTKSWPKTKFDHDKTKFPLRGTHDQAKCTSCHKDNDFKKKLKRKCIDCHRSDDDHKGRMGDKCDKCHSFAKWPKVKFSHDKDTKFKLSGRHAKLMCLDCHRENAYKEKLGKLCHDCHKTDDVHKGEQGKKCNKCHNVQGWGKRVKFDHNKTKFPLVGVHAVTTCENCHLSAKFKEASTKCVDCHMKVDVHKRRLGPKCDTCHNSKAWKLWKFDHDKQTKFSLKGAHDKVACLACHTQPVKEKIKMGKTCFSCHKSDDVHKGQEGKKCDKCHNAQAWGKKVRFDHDLTRFPLIGIHAIASCESCHLTAAYKETSSKCMSCHADQDTHKLRLGPTCETCHNPNGWKLWEFDHNGQTNFKLDGSHEGLECEACHTQPAERKIRLSARCYGCHAREDVHRGRFGRRCERCHVTTSFEKVQIRR